MVLVGAVTARSDLLLVHIIILAAMTTPAERKKKQTTLMQLLLCDDPYYYYYYYYGIILRISNIQLPLPCPPIFPLVIWFFRPCYYPEVF